MCPVSGGCWSHTAQMLAGKGHSPELLSGLRRAPKNTLTPSQAGRPQRCGSHPGEFALGGGGGGVGSWTVLASRMLLRILQHPGQGPPQRMTRPHRSPGPG